MKRLLILQYNITAYRYDFFNAFCSRYDVMARLFTNMVGGRVIDPKEYAEKLNFTYKYLPNYREGKVLSAIKALWYELRTLKPDVVLTNECNIVPLVVLLYRFLTCAKFKVVSIIDDSYEMAIGRQAWSRWHPIAEWLMIPWLDEVISLDPRVTQIFQHKYGKGFYFPIMHEEQRFRGRLEEALPLSTDYVGRYHLENRHVFLFVGRLVEVKNLPMLIKTFQKLPKEETALILVGDGEMKQNLKQIAGDRENIHFTGHLTGKELMAWYHVADTFILPSTMECYGAVVNEALVAGCFSIVSSRAGSQTLIKDGVNGMVFNPSSEESLLRTLRSRMAEKEKMREGLRQSLMPFTFGEKINELMNHLEV